MDNLEVLRVQVTFSAPWTSDLQNVFHLQLQNSSGVPDGNLASDVSTWLTNAYENVESEMHVEVEFREALLSIVDYIPLLGWRTTRIVDTIDSLGAFEGQQTADPLPAANSLMIRYPTLGPGIFGRKYLFGFTEAANDTDGTPTTVAQAAVLDFGSATYNGQTITGGPSGTLTPCVPATGGPQVGYLVGAIVANRWYVQKRRRVWIGQ